MSETPPNSSKQSTQSSDGEKTPGSGKPRTKRAHTTSPSLQAFYSFREAFAQFSSHIETKIDQIGTGTVHQSVQTDLEGLDNKCERMKKDFEDFILRLGRAITSYEKKKSTDLGASAATQAANRSSSFKITSAHHDLFTALNTSICNIELVISKRIQKSIYDEQYSIHLENKLKNLKEMCEDNVTCLETIGNKIKRAIERMDRE